MTTFNVNGRAVNVAAEPDTPLLWVLRDDLGADRHQVRLRHGAVRRLHRAPRRRARSARASRRCRAAAGQAVTTIEGLSPRRAATRCSRPGSSVDVPQCGYCQSGQIMAAAALLAAEAEPDRRRHRRSDERATSAAAAPTSASARAIQLAAALEARGGLTMPHSVPRAQLPQGRGALGRRPRARLPAARPGRAAAAPPGRGGRRVRAQRLRPHRPRRRRDRPREHTPRWARACTPSLPMLVAEELERDWSRCASSRAGRTPAYNHPAFGIQITGGSTSIAGEWEPLRKAGAAARDDAGRGRGARVERRPPAELPRRERRRARTRRPAAHLRRSSPSARRACRCRRTSPLKDPKDFKLIGKPTRASTRRPRSNGKAIFGLDVKVPGHARRGGRAAARSSAAASSARRRKARAVPGVEHVVQVPARRGGGRRRLLGGEAGPRRAGGRVGRRARRRARQRALQARATRALAADAGRRRQEGRRRRRPR